MLHAAASAFVTGADRAVLAGAIATLVGALIAFRMLRAPRRTQVQALGVPVAAAEVPMAAIEVPVAAIEVPVAAIEVPVAAIEVPAPGANVAMAAEAARG